MFLVFHNSWKYDHHFNIKELANKFEGQFECLRQNTKIQTFFCTNRGNPIKVFNKLNNSINV